MKYADIEQALKDAGHGMKRETIGKHFAICLAGRPAGIDPEMTAVVGDAVNSSEGAEHDFAVLVRDRAAELLREGHLKVTATHGLAAQALLDRRAEKQADRDLALNMARLLSGAISLPPSDVIEGRVLAMEESPLLAPASVVEAR